MSRGGNVHDSEMAIKLLSKIALADNAFCSEDIRNFIFQEKAEVCIADKLKINESMNLVVFSSA